MVVLRTMTGSFAGRGGTFPPIPPLPPGGGVFGALRACAGVRCFFCRADPSLPCGMESIDATEAAAITVERRIFFICRKGLNYPTMSPRSDFTPGWRGKAPTIFCPVQWNWFHSHPVPLELRWTHGQFQKPRAL